jgi:hypothetical protein
MKLVFIYGQAASGKLTIARELAERTGMALFHNHLVVDAVQAVFPFGSESFVKLRERFWLDMFSEATKADRSLIFTFAPEATVTPDFAERVRALVQSAGGEVIFVALTVPYDEQERRITSPDRAAHGKLRSVDVLRELRAQFDASMANMPEPAITIDTAIVEPGEAALAILATIHRSASSRPGCCA